MKEMVLILVTNFIRLIISDCTQSANRSTEYNRNRYRYDLIVHSIETTCHEVNFPIESIVKMYTCENCPQTLRILSSNSTIIASASFLGYPSSTSLYLENLKIENFAPRAFSSLPFLKSLYLSGNFITRISVGIFNSLFNLEKLDLSRNKIAVLDSQSLAGMVNMNFLNLSVNVLSDFNESLLDPNIKNLNVLDLSSNRITKFLLRSSIPKVKNLNLSHNLLDNLNFCSANLESIDLSKNLSSENINCSNVNFNLETFYLSYNNISDLADIFNGPNQLLTDLTLDHNNISRIPTVFFSNLHNLARLNLSYNKIQQFRHGTFDSLQNLKILDLSYNSLTTIERYYLHNLVNLNELHLQHNDLKSLNSTQLIGDLPKLSLVSLHNNNFTCNNLIDIIHDFRKLNINIEYGDAKDSSNIHGISCLDSENLNTKFEDIIMNKLDQISNRDFEKSAMYDYFNNDFKKSDFYIYMQNLQKFRNHSFNETEIFKYFDKDFENTKFYKYLEGMKGIEKFSSKFNESVYDYFNKDFRNSSFVKYLDELGGTQDFVNKGFSKSDMYKFFNTDFENSQFYKYLESLRRNSFDVITSAPQYGKITNPTVPHNNPNYTMLLALILISSISILILQMLFASVVYKIVYKKSIINYMKNEQVELTEA